MVRHRPSPTASRPRVAPALAALALVWVLGPIAARAEAPPAAPAAPAKPATAPKPKRLYVGGGVGLGFGDLTYIEVSPLLGYRVAPRVTVGGSLLYRYRSDDRYDDTLTTSDYGASGFVRGDLYQGFFLQGEYEYLNYEFPVTSGTTERDGFSSVLVGPGYSSPIGGNGSVYFAALYNFSYDSNDLNSPYDDAWVIRVGVGFVF
jgi:hypothetical protein